MGGEITTQNNLEENKRIVRAFIETAFNKHQIDRVGDHLTPDMKWHGGTLGTVEGRENFVGLVGAIVSALPDLRILGESIELMIPVGD
jgi:predicted SnoaL-like aldol condensation-catalyzing enzyme